MVQLLIVCNIITWHVTSVQSILVSLFPLCQEYNDTNLRFHSRCFATVDVSSISQFCFGNPSPVANRLSRSFTMGLKGGLSARLLKCQLLLVVWYCVVWTVVLHVSECVSCNIGHALHGVTGPLHRLILKRQGQSPFCITFVKAPIKKCQCRSAELIVWVASVWKDGCVCLFRQNFLEIHTTVFSWFSWNLTTVPITVCFSIHTYYFTWFL